MLVDGRTWILLLLILGAQKTSVVDPHHPDVDPNSDFLFDADPDLQHCQKLTGPDLEH
jgi:hypothetical protein